MRRFLSLLLCCLLALFAAPAARGDTGKLVVTFFDVGQGDSSLLQMPSGEAVLIDGGDTHAGKRLVQYLHERGVTGLDMVIMTHPHADHIGGLSAVLKAYPVRLVLDVGLPTASRTYTNLLKLIDKQGITLKLGRKGMSKDYGAVHMEVLAPEDPLLSHSHSDPNNNSIVTRWTYGSFSLLETGDVEHEGLDRLMKDNRDLSAQVLKVPHHGSRYTSTLEFLRAVHPEVAVISAGQHNDYGHPHKEALQRLAQVGAKVYVTAQDGTVTVTSDGKSYQVETTP